MLEFLILFIFFLGLLAYLTNQRANSAALRSVRDYLEEEGGHISAPGNIILVYPWSLWFGLATGEARNYDNVPLFKIKSFKFSLTASFTLYLETLDQTFVVSRYWDKFTFRGSDGKKAFTGWKNWPEVGAADHSGVMFKDGTMGVVSRTLGDVFSRRYIINFQDGRQAVGQWNRDGYFCLDIPDGIPDPTRLYLAGYLLSLLSTKRPLP